MIATITWELWHLKKEERKKWFFKKLLSTVHGPIFGGSQVGNPGLIILCGSEGIGET